MTKDEAALEALASTGAKVDLRVTPYQVEKKLPRWQNSFSPPPPLPLFQVLDRRRPWVGQEEESFRKRLSNLGVPVERELFFADDPPSLERHFAVLDTIEEKPIRL